MKYVIITSVVLLLGLIAGLIWWLFPDAKFEKKFAEGFGSPQYIRCYSGNEMVLEDVSTGKIYSEAGSDGYYWKSALDAKLYEVSADCVFRTASRIEKKMDYRKAPQYQSTHAVIYSFEEE